MSRLLVVGTPIGNLGDLSPRGVKALEECDFIAAEDTRVTLKLLNHFGIKKPLVSYHEHNHITAGKAVLNRLLAGESCALVTDAGTPPSPTPARIWCGCARKTAWRSGPYPAAAPLSTRWQSAVCLQAASRLRASSPSTKKAAGSISIP